MPCSEVAIAGEVNHTMSAEDSCCATASAGLNKLDVRLVGDGF